METINEYRFNAGLILKQLGGNKFIAMTGAKDFIRDDKKSMIGFKIGHNCNNINYVRITLNSMDTYDMEFLSIRKFKVTIKHKSTCVYCDNLQRIFTHYTGMDTHL